METTLTLLTEAWAFAENFCSPAYIITFTTLAWFYKWVTKGHYFVDLPQDGSMQQASAFTQRKRIAVAVWGFLLAAVFYFRVYGVSGPFTPANVHYIISLFVSYALSTTLYELLLRYVFRWLQGKITNLVEKLK